MSSTSPPPPVVPHTDDASKLPTDASKLTTDAASSALASTTNHQGDTNRYDGGLLQGKTFVQKIHSLLKISEYSSIISWNDDGAAVTVHDVDSFISTIVPTHFKATKFGSFIRKMRRWGFSVITKKSSPSTSSTSSERGQVTVLEFSSEHFLRDQPDRCLFMKDERHVKKQFSFLDRNVKKVNNHDMKRAEGSTLAYCFKQPQAFAPNMNTGWNNQFESQQQFEAPSTVLKNTCDGVSTETKDGIAQKYFHDNTTPSAITPNQYLYQNTMPMMNNMMVQPPPPPSPHCTPYGYDNACPPPPKYGFEQASYPFPYQAPNGQSPHYSQQNQNHQHYPQQQPQHQMMMHQDQNQMLYQNQQYPTNDISFTANTSFAVVSPSADDSTELLPHTKRNPQVQIQ